MIKTLLLSIIWLVVFPCFIGLYLIKYSKKENKNILLSYIIGIFNDIIISRIHEF